MSSYFLSKKFILLLLSIGVAAVIIVFLVALLNKQFPGFYGKHGYVHKEVTSGQLPQRFPAYLPIESQATTSSNFNSLGEDGTLLASRTYASSVTPDQNYKKFTDYFQNNGWKITASSTTGATKSVTAQQGDTTIQVLSYISIDAAKQSTVKVDVTIQPLATK